MFANAETIRETRHAIMVSIPNAATQRTDLAYLTDEGTRWYSVQWIGDDEEPYIPGYRDCWAWVEDDVLYLPTDGQTDRGQRNDDDQPDPDAGWYDPATGIRAILGLPGSTMVRLI